MTNLIEGGWHVKVRDDGECCIDVMQMLFSYRIVLTLHPGHEFIEHGWCFFGHGVDDTGRPRTMAAARLAAFAAALAWDGYGSPTGYDKQAC